MFTMLTKGHQGEVLIMEILYLSLYFRLGKFSISRSQYLKCFFSWKNCERGLMAWGGTIKNAFETAFHPSSIRAWRKLTQTPQWPSEELKQHTFCAESKGGITQSLSFNNILIPQVSLEGLFWGYVRIMYGTSSAMAEFFRDRDCLGADFCPLAIARVKFKPLILPFSPPLGSCTLPCLLDCCCLGSFCGPKRCRLDFGVFVHFDFA